jgi:hypothetical protein
MSLPERAQPVSQPGATCRTTAAVVMPKDGDPCFRPRRVPGFFFARIDAPFIEAHVGEASEPGGTAIRDRRPRGAAMSE